MAPIKVLIVDDSIVVRRIISETLREEKSVQIVGTAPNGNIALAKISHLQPDIIILDLEMPEMDGLQTIREIRKIAPKLPILVFSAFSERGGRLTLEALSLGANDYITKPQEINNINEAMICIKEMLLPRITSICNKTINAFPKTTLLQKIFVPTIPHSTPKKIEVIAIGVSTGGPNTLQEILSPLPKDFPVPIVIVQHMPPIFTRLLAERLHLKCQIPVHEASHGEKLVSPGIWIAPGGLHLVVSNCQKEVILKIHEEAPENFCRPSVDVLFQSIAKVYGPYSLGVILTGMGSDGLIGSQSIREAGGQIFAQDEATSVVWGMPGQIVRAGLSNQVVPLHEITNALLKAVSFCRNSFPTSIESTI